MGLIGIERLRLAAPTADDTDQDFEVEGFGAPQAVIFIFQSGAADSTPADDVRFSFGYWARHAGPTDRQFVIHASYKHGQSDTPIHSTCGNTADAVIKVFDPDTDDGTVEFRAVFDSVLTDGVRINWTKAASGGGYVTAILLKGLEGVYGTSMKEDDLTNPDDDMVFTGCPFEPDVAIALTTRNRDDAATPGDLARLSIGFAVNDGTSPPPQGSMNTWISADAKAGYVASISSLISDDTILVHTKGKATEPSWARRLADFTSDGCELVQLVDPAETRYAQIGVLFLKLAAGMHAKIAFDATPTGTGTHDIDGIGFLPDMAIGLLSTLTAFDNLSTNALANVFGVSVVDATGGTTNAAWVEYESEPRVAKTQVSAKAIDQPTWALGGSAGSDLVADLDEFHVDGMTLDYTSVDSTARKLIWLLLGVPTIFDPAPVITAGATIPSAADLKGAVLAITAAPTIPSAADLKGAVLAITAAPTISPAANLTGAVIAITAASSPAAASGESGAFADPLSGPAGMTQAARSVHQAPILTAAPALAVAARGAFPAAALLAAPTMNQAGVSGHAEALTAGPSLAVLAQSSHQAALAAAPMLITDDLISGPAIVITASPTLGTAGRSAHAAALSAGVTQGTSGGAAGSVSLSAAPQWTIAAASRHVAAVEVATPTLATDDLVIPAALIIIATPSWSTRTLGRHAAAVITPSVWIAVGSTLIVPAEPGDPVLHYKRITEQAWMVYWAATPGTVWAVRRAGVLLGLTARNHWLVHVAPGEYVDVEVLPATAAELEASAETSVELSFERVAGARLYRIEEWIGGNWMERARIDQGSAERLVRRMRPLQRGAENRYRVTPIDAAGNLGTPTVLTVGGVRPPDVPEAEFVYDENTGMVTVDQ